MTPRISDASEIPVWGWMGWSLLALVAISVLVFLAVKRDLAPDVHDEATSCDPVQAAFCAVPFCDEQVTIHLHVGHDWWDFCLAHGMPYLTEGLRDREDAS